MNGEVTGKHMAEEFTGLVLDNKYEIEAVIGSGGMGLVFQAHDHALRRRVAIKIIRPEYAFKAKVVGAFVREAHTIASLEHPYILRVYDFGTHIFHEQNLLYLVMSYAPGGTLAERLQLAPVSLEEAERILRQISKALDYAHERGVIHLDLKPLNILFDQQGNVQVADFGIAYLLEDTDRVKVETGIGTRNYMPPEQLVGDEVGPFSDIYAIGLMLHEMLAGLPPARSISRGMFMLTLDDTIPATIRNVIHKAAQTDPDMRHQTASELFDEFQAALYNNRRPTPQSVQHRTNRHEEMRRMDAAMPSRTVVEQPTEVWVQICLPDSPGFRNELPQSTPSGDVITQHDVQQGKLTISFPVNTQTGQPDPTHIEVEVRAPDFRLDDSRQNIMLFPHKDSGKVLFSLIPTHARKRSVIHVTARQTLPDGSVVTIGAASLATRIVPTGVRLAAQIAWNMISLPLAAISIRQPAPTYDDTGDAPPETTPLDTRDLATEAANRLAELTTEQTVPDAFTGSRRRAAAGRFTSRANHLVGGALALAVLLLVGILVTSINGDNGDDSGLYGAAVREQRPAEKPPLSTEQAKGLPGRSPFVHHISLAECNRSVSFYTTGTQFACLDANNIVQIWDFMTNTRLNTITLDQPADRIVLGPDSNLMALTGSQLWNVQTGDPVLELANPPTLTALSPDNMHLATWDSTAGIIQVWNLARGTEVFTVFASEVTALSTNGATLAVATGKTVQLWDNSNQLATRTIPVDITSIAINQDADLLATGHADSVVRLWDAQTGDLLETLQANGPVAAISFAATCNALAVTQKEETQVWIATVP